MSTRGRGMGVWELWEYGSMGVWVVEDSPGLLPIFETTS
jgi:hypothetical protein